MAVSPRFAAILGCAFKPYPNARARLLSCPREIVVPVAASINAGLELGKPPTVPFALFSANIWVKTEWFARGGAVSGEV